MTGELVETSWPDALDVAARGLAAARDRRAASAPWSAAASPSRTRTPTPSSPAPSSAATTSTSGPARTPRRRRPSWPPQVAGTGIGVTYADLEAARAVVLVGLRARGGVADPVPAPAQGGPPRQPDASPRSPRWPAAACRSCPACSCPPHPAARREVLSRRRAPHGARTRVATALRVPRAPSCSSASVSPPCPAPCPPRPRWPRPPAPAWRGCRVGRGSAGPSRPAPCPTSCPAAARWPSRPWSTWPPPGAWSGLPGRARPRHRRHPGRRGGQGRRPARRRGRRGRPAATRPGPGRPGGRVVRRQPRGAAQHASPSTPTSSCPSPRVAEKTGSFMDWEGRLRPFDAVLPTDALSDHGVLDELAAPMGVELGAAKALGLRDELAQIGAWDDAARPPRPPWPPGTSPCRRRRPGRPRHLAPAAGRRAAARTARPTSPAPRTARTPGVSPATAAATGLVDGGRCTSPVSTGPARCVRPGRVDASVVDGVVWVPTRSRGSRSVRGTLGAGAGDLVGIAPAPDQLVTGDQA